MLISTFQHLQGIGKKKERDLWRSGIISWQEFKSQENNQLSIFENNSIKERNSILSYSLKAYKNGDADFFAEKLAKTEYYRISLGFPENTIFLDIETTGLSKYYDTITVIGWSLGQEYQVHIAGDSDKNLREALAQSKAIVTFNGSLFDLPFLRQEFNDINIPKTHVDLRFFARRVGLSGGQKSIENQLSIKRPSELLGLDGENAPVLWHKYRRGDLDSLKLLISYNHADIEGMKQIFDAVVQRLLKKENIPIDISSIHHFSEKASVLKWCLSNGKKVKNGIKIRPYSGEVGPAILLKDLLIACPRGSLRVVGIDLTGSETRPSGWCLLEDNLAITQKICSDIDIIKATLEANPDVVSIDSPLSLPKGRLTVYDNDPGRKTYGIMRECERILKKRGINVYPSLIRSMQELTARGIRLAHHFRSMGLPVIESYPGAAQDIMSIPRKGAGLEFLRQGLIEFGIRGDFLEHLVSHDELDAITSAIVGFFFWSGKFEALGNDDEEYLIIPDLKTLGQRSRTVVGLSGEISAGKTTASEFLKSREFYYGRFSLVLADILLKQGITPNRETLQKLGEEVHKNPGQRWLCQELVRSLPQTGNLVIDGLRFPEDHAFCVETFGSQFIHIHIDAPKKLRLERYVAKKGSAEEFMNADRHNVESEINLLKSLAHVVITNDGSVGCLELQLEKAIGLGLHSSKGDVLDSFKGDVLACLSQS
jgi:uncharacterized protein YprB with RNaseH-like and TPR domain/predicted nuclease with RNAse H fold/dephospho-CoA kinase